MSNRRIVPFLTLVVYLVCISIPLALSVVLLFTAETFAGRIFAIDALILLALPIIIAWSRRHARWKFRLPGATAVVFAVLLVALRVLVPQGPAATNSSVVTTHYPILPYQPWALSNFLPEIDQLKLGTYFVAFVDPIIDHKSAARFRSSLLGVYRPMEQDPAFRELGSAMSYAYADQDSGHFYQYIPKSVSTKRPAAVVFLHGSGGNFKGYLQVWKPIADAEGFLLIAPSFGFGNWQMPGGMETIERARKHAIDDLGADPSRIYLAGLSNGGGGVTRNIAALEPASRAWAGVILISAVMERGIIQGASGFKGLPVLVVFGQKDDRIPWSYVEGGLDALRTEGVDLTLRTNQEDHFVFFSHPNEVQQWIRAWLSPRLVESH